MDEPTPAQESSSPSSSATYLSLDPYDPCQFLHPSPPPRPLERRTQLSDQPEPTSSPLQCFIHPLELLLVFVFVYFTCTSDSAKQSQLRLQALPPLKITSHIAYSFIFMPLSIPPLPCSHYFHGHDSSYSFVPIFYLCRLAQYPLDAHFSH